MANITTVSDVRDAVETDLPDSVLSRMIEAAEDDLIAILPSDEREEAAEELTARQEQAVIDLVQLRVQYDGLQSQRSGSWSGTSREYHLERAKVLSRLLFAGDKSIVA